VRATSRRLLAAGSAAVVAVALAACNDDDASPVAASTSVAPVVVTTTIPRADDGVLRLGILLPQSGPGASLGAALIESAKWALTKANEHYAYPEPIEWEVRDEGGDPGTAGQALDELLNDEQVDAVIGPASSTVALSVLDQLVSAGVVACSPTATADALSTYPDRGLFFRTIGADALEAQAMAEAIARTGLTEIAIATPDDDYGRAMFSSLSTALDRRVKILGRLNYDPEDESFREEAATMLTRDPAMLAVIGDSDSGPRLVAALTETDTTSRTIVVSSALRRPSSPDIYTALAPEDLALLRGVSPAAMRTDAPADDLGLPAGDPTMAYAAEVIDCVNLIVLAAATRQDGPTEQPSEIAAGILPASRDGTPCVDIASCWDIFQSDRGYDYDGPGGLMRLDTAGDVTTAVYDEFTFTPDGRDVTTGQITVTAVP
jgi:branched-chain amino acid transport system substrate-binding protein